MSDDVANEGGIFTPLYYVVEAAEAAIKAKLEERMGGVLAMSSLGPTLKALYPPPLPLPRWKQCLDAITKYRHPTLRYVLVPYEDTVQLMIHCSLCQRDHVGEITGMKIARTLGPSEMVSMLMAEVDALAESPCEADGIPLGPAGAR